MSSLTRIFHRGDAWRSKQGAAFLYLEFGDGEAALAVAAVLAGVDFENAPA
jgi:hypothetical protein